MHIEYRKIKDTYKHTCLFLSRLYCYFLTVSTSRHVTDDPINEMMIDHNEQYERAQRVLGCLVVVVVVV